MRTPEQTDKAISQLFRDTGIIEQIDPPPPIGTLPRPVSEGIIMNAIDRDAFIYSAPMKVNGQFIAFVNKGGITYKAVSANGLNSWTLTAANAPYGSIIPKQESFLCSYHKWHIWVQGYCTTYLAGSSNGILWEDMGNDRNQTTGEDRTLLQDGEKIRCYVRPDPPQVAKRVIGYMETERFPGSWSRIIKILEPEPSELLTEFYMMSVVKTSVGYFGLLSVYLNNGAGLMNLQLVYSANGKDNWIRCLNKRNFIDNPEGVKQMFGNWAVIGDTVYINTIECKRGHDELIPGVHHYSSRYKILVSDLIQYKP